MANFTAADVKKLRELTQAGMMDCKKALTEADGDFDKAVELLRVKGAAKAAELDGKTVGEVVEDLAITIGEKIELGEVAYFDGTTVTYMHKRAADLPPAVGVLVEFEGDEAAARAAAMQIAAMKAQYLTRDEVPADVVESERSIAEQKTREEGKPEQAIAKIVEGRLGGFFKEIVLLEQESVTESKKSVKAVLDEAGTTVTRFARFEVGA